MAFEWEMAGETILGRQVQVFRCCISLLGVKLFLLRIKVAGGWMYFHLIVSAALFSSLCTMSPNFFTVSPFPFSLASIFLPRFAFLLLDAASHCAIGRHTHHHSIWPDRLYSFSIPSAMWPPQCDV